MQIVFSMIGMALEVGAVFKRKVTLPFKNVAESGMPIQGRAAVHISDARYCKRFCGRLMENYKNGSFSDVDGEPFAQ